MVSTVSCYTIQVSYLATDEFFPDWKIWTQFLEQTVGGLKLDALSESHPIEVSLLHYEGLELY